MFAQHVLALKRHVLVLKSVVKRKTVIRHKTQNMVFRPGTQSYSIFSHGLPLFKKTFSTSTNLPFIGFTKVSPSVILFSYGTVSHGVPLFQRNVLSISIKQQPSINRFASSHTVSLNHNFKKNVLSTSIEHQPSIITAQFRTAFRYIKETFCRFPSSISHPSIDSHLLSSNHIRFHSTISIDRANEVS